MSNKLYEENDIQNIANAIRNKNGTEDTYKVSQMSNAINSIEVIEQATAEGESLSLANTKAMPYSDYVVEGKSEQETGKTKNLFDTSNILPVVVQYTISIQDGGFIIRTGSMSNGGDFGLLKNLCPELKVGDKFKFTWDSNATRNNSDVNYIYLNLYANTIRKDITYTCTQEMLDSETFFYGQQGEYYKNIMFYLEGQTSDYEPYGEKPSPSIPSEIHSVADDVNLLNEETLTHGQLMSNNVINSSQTKMGYSDFINVSNFTNITISLKNSNLGYALERIFYYDSSKNEISSESPGNPKTFTPPNNTVYVRISITTTNWSSSVTFDEVKDDLNIKLQKGTVVTPYSPYNQGTVTIKQRGTTENNDYTIQTEPLRSLPNGVKDSKESDGNHKKIQQKIFDGTETFGQNSSWNFDNTNNFTYTIMDMKSLSEPISNYFQYDSGAFGKDYECMGVVWGKTVIFKVNKTTASTPAEFKELVAQQYANGNPLIVQYELEEEIIEPLTQNQATTMLDIIKTGSYEGTTNIYTDEDVKPTIGVDYYKKG